MGKIKLPDEVNKKIDLAITAILKAAAEKMATDCDKEYRKVMSEFYAHYSPHTYVRSRETRFANSMRNGDWKSITTMLDKNTVQINYQIGSEFIDGSPYRADTSWVFNRTFGEGIHGWTPDEVLQYVGGHNYGYYGKNGQFYINRMLGWTDVPEPFSPSPMERMNEWAKQYRRPTNLRQILQPISREIFSKYL